MLNCHFLVVTLLIYEFFILIEKFLNMNPIRNYYYEATLNHVFVEKIEDVNYLNIANYYYFLSSFNDTFPYFKFARNHL